jgi:ketosteroid isomerase-like protein
MTLNSDNWPISSADEEAIRAHIEEMEVRRCAALISSDVDALEDLLADDLVHVHGSCAIDDRAGFLRNIADKYVFHAIERGTLNIRLYGDVAIVIGILKQTVSTKGSNERHELEGVTTQTWVRTGGTWRQNTCQNNFAKRRVVTA